MALLSAGLLVLVFAQPAFGFSAPVQQPLVGALVEAVGKGRGGREEVEALATLIESEASQNPPSLPDALLEARTHTRARRHIHEQALTYAYTFTCIHTTFPRRVSGDCYTHPMLRPRRVAEGKLG